MEFTPVSRLRSVFEGFLSKRSIITPVGRRRVYGFHIRVYSGSSCSVIALEADIGFPYTLARSYPLNPVTAYRVVCAL